MLNMSVHEANGLQQLNTTSGSSQESEATVVFFFQSSFLCVSLFTKSYFNVEVFCLAPSASSQVDGSSRCPAVFGAMLSYIRDIMDTLGVALLDEKVRDHWC